MKTLLSAVALVCILLGLTILSLDALDRSIYPGCKVLSQDGDILVIRLSDELTTGTDMACQKAGELIHQITKDGYLVQVVDSHLTEIGIIDNTQAEQLAEGY